ncbi:hypothetical protein NC651_034900 [Populus alba x Populus x berolinensis]|nr:hypothetical protein NC651_034900 [Populus alba x Populus x berolinensis]
MDNFNLCSAYRGSNDLERYDCFDVQCDNMYCYTITTDNEICLMQWIVRLFSLTFPNSGKRLKVCLSTPAFLRNHDVSVPLQTLGGSNISQETVDSDGLGVEIFDVQCDNMRCAATVTSNAARLMDLIGNLCRLVTNPDSGTRLRVSMDMIRDKPVDDDAKVDPPVSTLQFCYEHFCIIYHVNPPDNFPTSSLENFLNHDCIDFFGFEMKPKVEYLRRAYNLVVKNWFDIQSEARLSNPARFGDKVDLSLQEMVSMEFSREYSKATDLLQSTWRSSKLSTDQFGSQFVLVQIRGETI